MTAQRIIQQIFQQPELDRVSIVTLEGVVDEFPYFTAARLLLAQKNYAQYPNLQSPVVKKAQLYSNNPHYFFQFLTGELAKTDTYTPSPFPAPAPVKEPAPVEKQPVTNWEAITRRESEGELAFMIREREEIRAAIRRMEAQEEEEQARQVAQEVPVDSGQLTVDSEQPEAADAAPEAAYVENTVQAAPEITETAADTHTQEELAPKAGSFEEEALEEPITYAAPEAAATQEVEDSWEFTVGKGQAEEPASPAESIETPVTEEVPVNSWPLTVDSGEPEEVKEEEQETVAPVAELPGIQQTIDNGDEPIKIFPLDIPKEETTLTFQPLYTDDYFAYKRLQEPDSAEELNEKGMADMRSFTDWLREMKQSFAKKADKDWYHQQLHRIYVDDDPEVSEAVEKMAMESITLNDDIVSETLAEIWARQRQYQTAIQIYQKLSLLNPNKSAYFAQKIQELQLAQSEADKS